MADRARALHERTDDEDGAPEVHIPVLRIEEVVERPEQVPHRLVREEQEPAEEQHRPHLQREGLLRVTYRLESQPPHASWRSEDEDRVPQEEQSWDEHRRTEAQIG